LEDGKARTIRSREDKTNVAGLKHRVALDGYQVDSHAVADAILLRLRLLQRGRQAVAAQRAGRSRAGGVQRRPGR
jgi:hypothetical protein